MTSLSARAALLSLLVVSLPVAAQSGDASDVAGGERAPGAEPGDGASGEVPTWPPDAGEGATDVRLRANRLRHELSTQTWTATGNAVLSAPEVHLRARELFWNERTRTGTARGEVLVVQDGYVAVASEVSVDLARNQLTMVDGLVLGKRGVSRAALEAATTREALLALGRNEISLRGERITRMSSDHFRVEGLSFTPCDCDLATPSWAIRAAVADVYPGKHAVLRNWKVEVLDLQVTPPLPILDVPLEDRRTGLLVPHPTFSQVGGFSATLPFFLELGQSHDLTFTPGYTFGPNPFNYGMRGPSLGVEYRYAPAEGIRGRAQLTGYWDLREDRSPRSSALIPDTQRGLRWDAVFDHRQDFNRHLRLTADVRLVSDGYLTRDVTPDVLLRESQVLRSTASLASRWRDAYVGLDAVIRQDLRTGDRFDFFFERFDPTGPIPRAPATLQRLPGLAVSLPARQLAGPLFGSLRIDASRLAPWVGPGGDEGANGYSSVLFAPGAPPSGPDRAAVLRTPDAGEGNGLFDEGESERRVRLELRPSLSLPARAGPIALLASAGWRQSVTLGEITGRAETRGLPLLGASAETSVRRDFQLGRGTLSHAILPRAEVLWVPFTTGGLTGRGELWDTPFTLGLPASLQPTQLLQASVALRQRLDLRAAPGAATRQILLFEVGQNVSLLPPVPGASGASLADTFARLEARLAGLQLAGVLRVVPETLDVAQAHLTVGYRVPVFGVSGTYELARHEGSDRQLRGREALFGVGTLSPDGDVAQQFVLNADAKTPLHGVRLRASALFQPGYRIPGGGGPDLIRPFAQGTGGVIYAPACECWSLGVSGGATRTVAGGYAPLFTASLSLAGYGTVGGL